MKKDYSDQIFDSFLREVLSDEKPPNLEQRIQQAWRAEQLSATHPADEAAERIVAELVEADQADAVEPATASHSAFSRPRGSLGSRIRRRNAGRQMLVQVGLAVAAAAVLMMLGWGILNHNGKADRVADGSQLQPSPVIGEERSADPVRAATPRKSNLPSVAVASDDRPSKNAAARNIAEGGQPPSDRAEVLNLDNLPEPSIDSVADANPVSPSPRASAAVRMDDAQIIKLVDKQLRRLWTETGVAPSDALDAPELAQRLAERLYGQDDQAAGTVATEEEFSHRVDAAVQSERFTKYLAQRFARNWLARSSLDLADKKTSIVVNQVEKRIRQGNWNEIAAELVGGDLGPDSPSNAFLSMLGGGGNHRLVRRIGTHFLNVNIRCVRCHDAAAKEAVLPELPPSQTTYWSLLAMMKGIDIDSSGGSRNLVDRQHRVFSRENAGVYFESPDSLMHLARAGYPDGTPWRPTTDNASQPRRALGRWLAESRQMDQAAVNQTWALILGRPLVPHVGSVDVAGLQTRRELLEDIAEQFAAGGRDMKQLVSWIAKSQAFSRRPTDLTENVWLTSSKQQLEQLRLAELVFASASPRSNVRSLDNALSTAIALRSPASTEGPAVFAQPDLTYKNRINRGGSSAGSSNMPPIDFAIHGEFHTNGEQQFVDRLLAAAGLTWEERVAHVMDLNEIYFASRRAQQRASDLLQSHHGDQRAALLDLLWAVQISSML